MINIRQAYGDSMTRSMAKECAWKVVGNLGQSLAEGMQISRGIRSQKNDWLSLCEVEDPEMVQRLAQDPRPKIFVTAHLGSWEVAVATAAISSASKGGVVLRRVDNPFLHWILLRLKFRNREEWIEKIGAAERCIQKLKDGESIAMLLDENAGRRGLFVDFFGRPASTRKTAALLALITGTPIVVGTAIRKADKQRFLYRIALIEPSQYGDGPRAISQLTQDITSILEKWIRESPSQWRWVHWRWKNRPGGTVETYTRHDLRQTYDL